MASQATSFKRLKIAECSHSIVPDNYIPMSLTGSVHMSNNGEKVSEHNFISTQGWNSKKDKKKGKDEKTQEHYPTVGSQLLE